ncbi:mechanosensitive ion channel family protein [Lacinutrix sp. Hel_I_90]|uniref:mechanosensitive ion channel domain-containing protein n=1 Tax=Lacinutrix sp. Hel_I_90 TaxID=1249999 RepID=UPI0005C82FFD|nr:mechanosensitive ion channel family protein [Lacinutrix sp. Hel_I_90]
MFLEIYKTELINTGILLAIVIIIRFLGKITIRKIGQKSSINDARVKLISRYYTVTLFLIFMFVEAFVVGTDIKDISVMFSSVFAVIGIGLFAIWSILSNVTSGIIMFFSFPYKVGDKIKIHDKDYPIEAVIEDIRAFQLHLRIENGDLVTYPNNLILQKAVTLVEKDAIEDFGDFH